MNDFILRSLCVHIRDWRAFRDDVTTTRLKVKLNFDLLSPEDLNEIKNNLLRNLKLWQNIQPETFRFEFFYTILRDENTFSDIVFIAFHVENEN